MKLPIKKEYFDAIKKGHKNFEWRDAHITFVCEETGETLTKYVKDVYMIDFLQLPESLQCKGLFDDDRLIMFELR